jgi:ketol-acid reductoisomerase
MATRIAAESASVADFEGRVVAILGYGNQGRAQALNLRDSGVSVVIGQRQGKSFDLSIADGFSPVPVAEAAASAEVLMLTLPDESMAAVFEAEIADALRIPSPPWGEGAGGEVQRTEPRAKTLLFSHGFNLHFGLITPPDHVSVALISPKGQARGVRGIFLEGSGVPALVGVHQDADGHALKVALAYAAGCGYTRAMILETTFREETETDLFGEQAVLCGGMMELIKAGYEVLVERGYDPEMAYLECVHETKLIIDLLVERGLSAMRGAISDTAEWGGYQVGPKLVTLETRAEMHRALDRIQSGDFAREWIEEAQNGKPRLRAMREAEASHGVQLSFESLWGGSSAG